MNHSKEDEVKGVVKSKSDFNYDSNHTFFEFYKRIDEFKDMSLGSKYTIMKNFNKRLIKFYNVKLIKSETRLKEDRIIKNVEEVKKFTANIMISIKMIMTMVES